LAASGQPIEVLLGEPLPLVRAGHGGPIVYTFWGRDIRSWRGPDGSGTVTDREAAHTFGEIIIVYLDSSVFRPEPIPEPNVFVSL
jgi:hypothetical protein